METTIYDNPSSASHSLESHRPVDITNIQIDYSLPREERIRSYLQQIKNPYTFEHKGVVVNIAYCENSGSIEARLEEYLRWRQRQHCFCHDEDQCEEVMSNC